MDKLIQWLQLYAEDEGLELQVFPPTKARSEYTVYLSKDGRPVAVVVFPYCGTIQ